MNRPRLTETTPRSRLAKTAPRPRLRFIGRIGDHYWWESRPLPFDSRVQEVSCSIEWFWRIPK